MILMMKIYVLLQLFMNTYCVSLNGGKKVTKPSSKPSSKTVLKLAGVDVNIFKEHSTRAAFTSKATVSGLSLCEILEIGSWSSGSTCTDFIKNTLFFAQQ